MDENELRSALKACLADSRFPEERQQAVLRAIREGEKRTVKRKLSAALVFAAVLILAVGGVAIAAGMGVFGQQSANEMNEQSRERLLRLDDVAEVYDQTEAVEVSAAPASPEPAGDAQAEKTLYDTLMESQQSRRFNLTLNQAYCDGYKLYYSYTLTSDTPLLRLTGEGDPTGIDEWDMDVPEMQYAKVWQAADEEENRQNIDFFEAHPVGYVAQEHMGVGDGASLEGKPLNIYDSGETYSDGTMVQGFQEVELPEDYEPEDEIEIQLDVLFSASVIWQDEDGVRSAHIANPDKRSYPVTFKVKLNGETRVYEGSVSTSEYAATATVRVSDVDVSGEVVFDAPEWVDAFESAEMGAGVIASYTLVADGVEYPNRDGSFGVNANGQFFVGVRYDLPESLDSLVLVPTSSGVDEPEDGEAPQDERIVLTR